MMLRPKLGSGLGTSEGCLGVGLERLAQKKSGCRRAGEKGSQEAWLRGLGGAREGRGGIQCQTW